MGTSPVTLDFSKAVPIPQSSVTLDFSKAVPIDNTPPDTRNAAQRYLDNLTAPDPRREEWQSPAKNAADDFARHVAAPFVSMVSHPVQTFQSGAQAFGSALANAGGQPGGVAAELAKPAIQQVIQDYQAHGPVRGTLDAAGTVGGTWAAGELGGAAVRTIAPAAIDAMSAAADIPKAESSPALPGQNYAQPHAAAFEGALAPATGMGKNFQPQSITPQALTPIRQTAARMTQGSPLEQVQVQAATNPSTPPLTRIRAYQGVVQSALNDLEAQHAAGLASASNVPVNVDPLVQELRSHISATTDPADVSAIRNLIQRVRSVQDIGDLNTFRQELNNETSAEFKQSQIQAGRSGTSVQAASDLAGAVRGQYYDDLSNATGVNYQPLKIQESNLLTTKEALQNQQSQLAKQEATFNAPSTLRETLGNVANIIKDPKATVTQTLLRESPATRISTLLQKSLADLPPAPSSARLLPAGAPTPMQMPSPPGPQGGPTPPPPIDATTQAMRQGRLLPAPAIELAGAVQQAVPAYSPDTAPARLGRLLPQQSGAPTMIPADAASMTPGERSAALMQYLRKRQQLGLPAQAQPIQLPPPGGYQSLMSLRNGNQ